MSQTVFSSLPYWKRKALYLNVKEEISGAEIGRMLKVSPRTVQDNLKKLKEILSDGDISNPDESFNDVNFLPAEIQVFHPKILIYDIETTLGEAYHFNHWKVNIGMKHKKVPSHMLSHAWQWGLDGEVVGSILTSEEALNRNPRRIVEEAWHLLNDCDVLVAHNGKNFDVKKVNSYFLKYGLLPPSPYKVVDTLSIAKRKFRLDFNSLAFLAEYLGVEQKIDTEIDMWIDCSRGVQSALDEMLTYNKGDITTLLEVFKRLMVWDNDGVNMAMFNQNTDVACPHCSGDNIKPLEGKFVYTPQRKYQAFRCLDCGAVLRGNHMQGVGNKIYRVIS